MEDFEANRILAHELRDFAASGDAAEQRSVIVELGVPPPIVPPRTVAPPWRPTSPREPQFARDLADIEGHAAAMDQLEEALASLDLPVKPIRLNAAQAFVVAVTPAQLCAISRLPLVGVIRPNRTHSAPRRP